MKRLAAAETVVAKAPHPTNALEAHPWRPAVNYIGIDLHKLSSQICILDENDQVVEELSVKTERGRLAEVLQRYAGSSILLEASTESLWAAPFLESLGHKAVVADPNFTAMYASRGAGKKTDRRDARALAYALAHGVYREVYRRSPEAQQVRDTLQVREALVRTRAGLITQTKTLLRKQGLRMGSCSPELFVRRLGELGLPAELQACFAPLTATITGLCEQIQGLDQKLKATAHQNPVVQRLMTVPSVGLITALCFAALIERPERFESAHRVASYLGLVPSEHSTGGDGKKPKRGRVTKAGNVQLRSLLLQCAHGMMQRQTPATRWLWSWAQWLERKRNKQVAATALARRLGGILWAIMRDGTEYQAQPVRPSLEQQVAAEVVERLAVEAGRRTRRLKADKADKASARAAA
jgi:transposase